jgi:hypothetical protein
MLKMTAWNIYDHKGRYAGQYRAFAPETALCQYFMTRGRMVPEQALQYKHVEDDMIVLTYKQESFLLTDLASLPAGS